MSDINKEKLLLVTEIARETAGFGMGLLSKNCMHLPDSTPERITAVWLASIVIHTISALRIKSDSSADATLKNMMDMINQYEA